VRVSDTAVVQRADPSDAVFTIPGTATDIAPDDGTERIATFALRDPNPVRGLAHFSMTLPVAADIRVDVFDVAGRLVRTLVRGRLEAGSHPVVWDRRDAGGTVAPRGVYFVRARAGSFSTQRKLVVL